MAKQLLFSVTKADFDFQTFRSGGPGGQHQNKVESGVRIIHRASGARAESREERSQHANKQKAFLRLVETPTFKAWHKLETSRRLGMSAVAAENYSRSQYRSDPAIDKIVDAMMADENLKIEYL